MHPKLTEYVRDGVALLGDETNPSGVTLAFTERVGGVSRPPYESLNLGSHVGDCLEDVQENRRRVLRALGAEDALDKLVVPNQVHGSECALITSGDEAELARVREQVAAGCDAIVCSAYDVPVLLCFADCVPIILVTDSGFAVVHSGWKGTYARIGALACKKLCESSGAAPTDVLVYIGPHIKAKDYEVSAELLQRFVDEFGPQVAYKDRNLDLSYAIRSALLEEGIAEHNICEAPYSTASATDKFFSYRAEAGKCGRHAAVAIRKK